MSTLTKFPIFNFGLNDVSFVKDVTTQTTRNQPEQAGTSQNNPEQPGTSKNNPEQSRTIRSKWNRQTEFGLKTKSFCLTKPFLLKLLYDFSLCTLCR